jgi:hypothetical protein
MMMNDPLRGKTVAQMTEMNGGIMTTPDSYAATMLRQKLQQPGGIQGQIPNLRNAAEGEPMCNDCEHHDPQGGMCGKFSAKCEPYQTCDAYEPKQPGGAEMGMGVMG